MDIDFLRNELKKIHIRNVPNADVEVVNESSLKMIGKGRQGAVFAVTDDICVKVFGNKEDCEREYQALSMGKHTNLFPKVHDKGKLHIAMDMIKGVDLREYLQSQPLTPELSAKLIEMLLTFKEIGFERIDHHKRQIYLLEDGNLKVIDVARTIWRDRVYPYPRKLLNSLGEEIKQQFLSHVKELNPKLYDEWLHYIRMEELSRQICQVLMNQSTKKQNLDKLCEKLLIRDDEKEYVKQLHGLVHKVFKEEWVKMMILKGMDPEKVMQKIDEHWDSLKREEPQPSKKIRDTKKSKVNLREANHVGVPKKRYEGAVVGIKMKPRRFY
ncbi:hypothetical protein [Neobacillus sp.]|jgi:predicted Ser/Thr protein kinase|uniref:hypothetical protein n=1 Tax=Neobacillus sp. TaxID=2675273 RepID=UPI0035B5459B